MCVCASIRIDRWVVVVTLAASFVRFIFWFFAILQLFSSIRYWRCFYCGLAISLFLLQLLNVRPLEILKFPPSSCFSLSLLLCAQLTVQFHLFRFYVAPAAVCVRLFLLFSGVLCIVWFSMDLYWCVCRRANNQTKNQITPEVKIKLNRRRDTKQASALKQHTREKKKIEDKNRNEKWNAKNVENENERERENENP